MDPYNPPGTYCANLFTTTTLSNNLMNTNGYCNQYISPQQMAVMHYILRTDRTDILTSNSYNFGIATNSLSNYVVNTNQAFLTDKYCKGDIIIKPGAKLTVNCLLGMTAGSRIVVEPGGTLSVDGGTITNISGQLWNTIQVAGNPLLSQTISASGVSSQGILRIQWNGEISNAGNAVTNYSTTGNNGNVDWGSIGGIIIGLNAHFVNNRRDVEFLTYDNYASASRFHFCDFVTTRKLNNLIPPFAHVTMYDVHGVIFEGCNFEYKAGSAYGEQDRGMGIFTMDAGYFVNRGLTSFNVTVPSTFKNLTTGIRMENFNFVHTASILNSRFEDNTKDGIYLLNSWAFTLRENYFKTSLPGSNGIYVNSCKNFTIKNNILEEAGAAQNTNAMYIHNSQGGSHKVFRNSFSGFQCAINALNNNSGNSNIQDGLLMNCNDFTPAPNLFDIAMHGTGTGTNSPSVMRTQGVTSNLNATPFNVVRNKYSSPAPCGNQNRWYAAGAGINSLLIEHGTNSDAITKPTPQPACSNTIVNVVDKGFSLNYAAHCLAYLSQIGAGSPISANLNALNSNISSLRTSNSDQFELQSALSQKMDLFLRDSIVGSSDSIISLLTQNTLEINSSKVQLASAYINKREFSNALSVINTIEDLSLKSILTTMVDINQEPDQLYSIKNNETYRTILQNAAASKGNSQSIAQAALHFVMGTDFTEPRPVPGEIGARIARSTDDASSEPNVPDLVSIYPNPAQSQLIVSCEFELEQTVKLELIDIFGRTIYTGQIQNHQQNFIPFSSYSNGVYFITVSNGVEVMFKSKVIKQD